MAILTIPDTVFSRLKRLADAHHRTTDEEGTALLQKNLHTALRSEEDTAVLNQKVKILRTKQGTKVDHSIADQLKRETFLF